MRWGVCTGIADAGLLRRAGWDYIEENVQHFLQGELPDDQWHGTALAEAAELPVEAGCLLLSAKMKVVGPEVDTAALRKYMMRVAERAGRVGMKTLVFGSGGARKVPEDFSRAKARDQLLDFSRMAVELAQQNGITLVLEHLNRAECNIITTVAEELEYVRTLAHPHFRCLVDSYHLWQEHESLDSLTAALPWISHVHVADAGSRAAPGQSGPESERQYLAFFAILKHGGYDQRISVEARWQPPLSEAAESVLARLKKLWREA